MHDTAKLKHNPKSSRLRRYAPWLVAVFGAGIMLSLMATSGVVGAYYYVEPILPAAGTIREIPLQIPLRIFSRDKRLIEEVGERRRILVEYDDLPPFVVHAFISAEDRRFFDHNGIDPLGIMRAGLRMLRTGEISGGGSTITQQLARDYFLSRDQLFTRKLLEAILAYKIEQEFSKEEIMALFLNKMFFGQRAYGVAAAAQVYFGKNLSEINVAEAATLAGVLPAPSSYNPVRSPANALMRRGYVLTRMHDLGYIDESDLEAANEFPMMSKLHGTANELSAPYVAEMVRREMLSRYGEATYAAGFEVITTLDSRLQRGANYSVRNGLLEFTRRRGYRGPIATVELDPMILQQPYNDWPDAVKRALQDYGNPGGLSVAIVTRLNENNSADIVLQDGTASKLEWHGISWARPYIDGESLGAAPQTVAEVMAPGHIIYVMPITIGGWALAQVPLAQSGLVSIDPRDGAITALVGGFDFALNKFNRVTQARRQPGSSFKPFIYSAALEAGNTLATVVDDSPVVISSSELEADWRPINYSGKFYGPQRVREALVKSMNLASVRLLLYNTGIGHTVRHLRPFGFGEDTLIRNGSLALGGGNASPLDMAQAYATFANGGYAIKPYIIESIIGPDDQVLYRADPFVVCKKCEPPDEEDLEMPQPMYPVTTADATVADVAGLEALDGAQAFDRQLEEAFSLEQMAEMGEAYQPDASQAPELFAGVKLAERVISPQNAYLIQDAMREVIRRGTGVRARVLGRRDLSGKTGTSNDRRDAWFAGFNSNLVGVVWVGYDDDLPLGPREEGSRTALPIWIEFMKVALVGMPESSMAMPEGIVTVRISRENGCAVSAAHPFEDVMFEHFREDHVPECEAMDEQLDIFNTAEDPKKGETLF
ncbi:MAG: PBP1A family penicillin-binding protein [Woeseiaceae bacterium]|nr:PBP1A family penicillin-binding protein [Woeseiaceae bacterium]